MSQAAPPAKHGTVGGTAAARGKKAAPPRPIGFGGRHDHGKELDDPVYPTKHVPAALLPMFPQDWRSAGRALLCIGMAALEGFRLRSKGSVFKWQKAGYCSALCGEQCAKSPNRILCYWRAMGTVHDHHNRLDGLLMSYKGIVNYHNPKQPVFRPLNQVAKKNRFMSERMAWEPSKNVYMFADREDIHPAFGLRPDQDETKYQPGEETYDSDSDAEASSDEEDNNEDGCA
eukprot:TRINITY_DN20751_c0_g1_i1.p1 TRINITY_DN20751_c0_g1~~TRINITY_DN20751_c0_g1_i1.p1  ORF type:complete len:252 (+),score=47.19 TRINITY_DN20751_c0_g1_i1:67-756(+)